MNRYLAINKIKDLLLEDNLYDEEEIEGKGDDDKKNIINESDHVTDSEIEIDEEDEHSNLDVDSESFEDHDNDEEYFVKPSLWKLD